MAIECKASSAPDALWVYCPSYIAAILFAALFGLTTVGHLIQAFIYRKPFAFVLIMGAAWETAGYIARVLSVQNQTNAAFYTVQQLLILLAPLWINAYIYMLLGRMIHFFLINDRVFGVRARRITKIFVWFDIIAFFIQAVGGMMTTPEASKKTQDLGLKIYTAGVGVQLAFLSIFTSLAVGFQRKLNKQSRSSEHGRRAHFDSEDQTIVDHRESVPDPKLAKKLLVLLYITMTLVIIRNIYRLVEFSIGTDSVILRHEWFAYAWDAAPMFLAVALLNVFNPGKVLQGPRCDFSEENKAIKAVKKEKKAEKKRQKQESKRLKNVKYEGLGYQG